LASAVSRQSRLAGQQQHEGAVPVEVSDGQQTDILERGVGQVMRFVD